MVNVPGKICLRSSSYLQRSILCLDKVCKKWLQHKIGRNNKDPFQYSCGFLHRNVRFLGLLRRKDVVDRKRSRRKGEREEIKSRENREFEQCAEVESSENELRKTDQGMDKIVKALITDATDEKRTPKNVRNRSSSGGGSWNCHICRSHYLYWLVARYLQRLRAFLLENERTHFPFFQRKSPGTEKSCTSPIFCYRGSWLTQLLIPPPLCVFRALILTISMFFQLWFNFFIHFLWEYFRVYSLLLWSAAGSTLSWSLSLWMFSRKSRKLFRPGKLLCVCRVHIQDQSFNNFENQRMKLPVNEAKLTGLSVRNCATIQQVWISLPSGQKSFRAFRKTGPWCDSISVRHFSKVSKCRSSYPACTRLLFRLITLYIALC